jgi:hypothetical protein
LLIGAATSMPVALAGNLLYTWAIIVASVTMRSMRQVLVPRDLLGRVTASWRLGGQGVTLVGALLAGAMAGLLGGDPRPVFAAAGALTLLTVTVAWFAGLRREQLPASILASPPASGESQDPVSAGRERSVIKASSPANNASAADR